MRRQVAILAIALVAGLWMTGVGFAPTWGRHTSSGDVGIAASAVVYTAGSLICHQRPERSFHRHGAQLPVCARCTGLYAGALVGVLAWAATAGLRDQPSARAVRLAWFPGPRTMLIIVSAPTMISVVTAWFGWWDPANVVRSILALPLGAGIGAVVTAVGAGDLR